MEFVTNAHTHLELTGLRHLCPREPMRFEYWMLRLARHIRQKPESVEQGIADGIAMLKRTGTTHVGDITATWRSVDPLLKSGLKGVVYLEVLGLARDKALQRLEKAQRAIRRYRSRSDYGPLQIGLSIHAPYSCHPDLFREGATWCRSEGIPLCVHVAESPMERELFLHGSLMSVSWPLRVIAWLLGIRPAAMPHITPMAYLGSLGVLYAKPILVHTVQVDDQDIALIRASGSSVIHCPRSNHNLSCGRMPIERYLAAGVNVYLGTDSLASSPSLDVLDDAEFAKNLHGGLVAQETITGLVHKALEG